MARRKKSVKRRAGNRSPRYSAQNLAIGMLVGKVAAGYLGGMAPLAMAALGLVPGSLGTGAIGKTAALDWATGELKSIIGG